jgi:competence protein ComEC
LKNYRLLNSISNHPFIFLLILAILASCCMGGFLITQVGGTITSIQLNNTPILISGTSTLNISPSSPNATIQKSAVTETLILIPTNSVFPTQQPTNTVILENTKTITITTLPLDTKLPFYVTFIDVGQGDAILIVSPEGKTVLIDGGSSDSGVLSYLKSIGISRINIMIATHPHEDHIGGLIQVLETIPVDEVITNGQSHTTSTYEHFLDAILNTNAKYIEVARGDTIALGSLNFNVLNPLTISDELNQNSLVLRLTYGTISFLFMGDADMYVESDILSSGITIKANILKIGHHGSCYSTSPSFLDAVNPEVGIYSAGQDNQYGHPCPGTINLMNQRNILIFGTDNYGSIIVTVTDIGYTITNESGQLLWR